MIKNFNRFRGFTLIELLLVMSVVALLCTIGFPTFGYLRQKAQEATCMSNLKAAHRGFVNYLNDHNNCWPQVPQPILDSEDETRYWKFWRDSMKEYDVIRRNWICPADSTNKEYLNNEDEEFIGSYLVTEFDEFPNTAYNWRQPWLMERGEHHGRGTGPNAVMPDGSVVRTMSVFGK